MKIADLKLIGSFADDGKFSGRLVPPKTWRQRLREKAGPFLAGLAVGAGLMCGAVTLLR